MASQTIAQTLVWNGQSNIDPKQNYWLCLDNFEHVNLTPYTSFNDGATMIKMSGVRLKYLINYINKHEECKRTNVNDHASKYAGKVNNCKNVCFKNIKTAKEAMCALRERLRLPPCVLNIINGILASPRGDMFDKRYVLNTYILNVVSCQKCDNVCISHVMQLLYNNETKCVKEFQSLLKKSENLSLHYKPPNCAKLLSKGICRRSSNCKGRNPICNF
ncbi:LEF-2 [Urbanus proteus nucleopolyhedrovirus]|uniref:LEF-2 n=1 Tax=Urbanus proteus nucleopolyhedrovirus TaxID=1675866 RepID=A0A162GU53_9ABAC|nr:LEF-2 [Urbanus proteus nucleopolyhedrovirus]AKR17323.1 LEF-2 [Urbanus proteus nucleopolyhedrovirus]